MLNFAQTHKYYFTVYTSNEYKKTAPCQKMYLYVACHKSHQEVQGWTVQVLSAEDFIPITLGKKHF